VYWSCAGRDDIFRVRNVCLEGVFVETREPRAVGSESLMDFLVEEGQIRTGAVVRHVERAGGMGLQFTAVAQEDRPHLAALLARLRRSSPPQHSSA